MRPTLAEAFAVLAPDLRAPLFGESARQTLARLVTRVPDVWSSFGFECRLGASAGEVDLGLSVTPDACAALEGPGGGPRLERAVANDRSWRRLRDFVLRWRDPSSTLREWAPFLFLEYDAASATRPIPVPSVFVALDTPLRDDAGVPHLVAAREAASLLHGGSLAAALDVRLGECFSALPRSGCVLHLGVMLGRDAQGLRLSVDLPGAELCPYLERIGGAAAGAVAARLLDALPKPGARTQLDFDFDSEVRPRIGLGLRPDPAQRESWGWLLDAVVGFGGCERAKADALLAWPGRSARAGVALRRQLSHVKLVATPGEQLAAKAYFGAELPVASEA